MLCGNREHPCKQPSMTVPAGQEKSFSSHRCRTQRPALAALHAVRLNGGVEKRNVLVAGGAGAVGHYAVQFARLLGAHHVLATVSSAEKAAFASAAGANTVIDYRRDNVVERIREATH